MNLKEVYNHQFLESLANTVAKVDPKFSKQKFSENFPAENWAKKELKQRMRAISLVLDETLSPPDFSQKIAILKQVVVALPKEKYSGLALIIFPDFVEVFGLKNFDEAMAALEFFTEFGSSEFAVRQFIKLDSKRALVFFSRWSKSKNHHVRRLASEGLRPRLPWGEALNEFKKNPAAILPILENLKHDESEYVRKSVANNLNDISKDHPQLVLDLMKKWQIEVEKWTPQQVRGDKWGVCHPALVAGYTHKLIKHALRTLLKKGDKQALALIGVDCNNLSEKFLIENFSLQKTSIEIAQNLQFDFSLCNQVSGKKIRLEYAVYFLKQNGSHTKKIFQITTKNFAEGVFSFSKKHSFRDLTTRKHYAGGHLISLVVNGLEMEKKEFDLTSPL